MKPLGKLRENVYMPAIYKAMPAKIELDGGLGPYRHWHNIFKQLKSNSYVHKKIKNKHVTVTKFY